MPTYQVTDPQSGRTLRLTGDSPPTEQELEQIFASQLQPAPESRQEDQSNIGLGMARSATEGLTFGWGDEVGLGLAAIAAKISGDDKPVGDIYNDMREAYQYEQGNFEEEHPYLAAGAKVAGGLASGIPAGAKMLPSVGASAVRKLATYGATGAATAAVTGAGENEDGDRLEDAIQSGIAGGILSTAIPGAGMALTKAGKKIAERLPSQAKTIAGRQVANDIADAGLDKASAIARLKKLGPESTLADITDQTRARAEAIAQIPGAGNIASKLYIKRNIDAGRRIAKAIEGINKGKIDLGQYVDDVINNTKEEASPLYRKVFNQFSRQSNPITIPKNSLLARNPTSKLLYNLQSNRLVKRAAESRGLNINRNEPMGLEEWDTIKKGLDDIGYGKTATNIMGRVEGDVLAARKLSKKIVDELDDLVKKGGGGTSYKDARAIYSGSAKAIEAAEKGEKFLSKTPQQIDRILKSMSKSERDAYKTAGLQRIYDEALKTTEGGSVYSKLFNNAANKMKIRALLQDDDAYESLRGVLKAEREMNMTYRNLTQGSQTARRLAGANEAGIDLAPAADVAMGRPITAAINWSIGKLRQMSISPAMRKELADILMSPGPEAEAQLNRIMTQIPLEADRRLLAQIMAVQTGMAVGRYNE